MDIFESLENLNVSEECFEDIVGLVEEYINERGISVGAWARAAANDDTYEKRKERHERALKEFRKLPQEEQYKSSTPQHKELNKAFSKVLQIEKVRDLNLPKNSKVSSKKLLDAAERVAGNREEEWENKQVTSKKDEEDLERLGKRSLRTEKLTGADPTSNYYDSSKGDYFLRKEPRKANQGEIV